MSKLIVLIFLTLLFNSCRTSDWFKFRNSQKLYYTERDLSVKVLKLFIDNYLSHENKSSIGVSSNFSVKDDYYFSAHPKSKYFKQLGYSISDNLQMCLIEGFYTNKGRSFTIAHESFPFTNYYLNPIIYDPKEQRIYALVKSIEGQVIIFTHMLIGERLYDEKTYQIIKGGTDVEY
jgi:hypothetical protein